MSSILDTLVLWVAKRGNRVHVLAPGDTGLPELIELGPPILRGSYLSPGFDEEEIHRTGNAIDQPNGCLLVRTGDGEAPPASTALVFAYERTEQIDCRIGTHPKRVDAHVYLATTKTGHWPWNSDLAQGKQGYFLTGGMGRTNLWRIRRAEIDFASRVSFTIVPVTPSNGLPTLSLASISSDRMRDQIEQHWSEFVEVYNRQLPLRTVNAAKDVCECLMYDVLSRDKTISGGRHELGDLLKRLFEALNSNRKLAVPLTFLHFYQLQKIRTLHGRIHAGRVATQGAISHEVALSVAVDLVEILTVAGLVGS